MTLLLGNIRATGTPSGIRALQRGDSIEIVIVGVGTLWKIMCGVKNLR
jgi:2-keto-4-pentenoate hydratase/2-oxohepta-3-ene-1,7-dioic acid hydratase in catechol pathway